MSKAELAQLAIALDRFTTAHNLLRDMSVPPALGNPTSFHVLLGDLADMQATLRAAMDSEFAETTEQK